MANIKEKWMVIVMYADSLAIKDTYFFNDEKKARAARADLIVENPNCIVELDVAI